jgi:hypothetical protein
MLEKDKNSRRRRERFKLALPVRVCYCEELNQEWVEMTRLEDVTPFGARFMLSRSVMPGRLLHLILPMPRQLRCYDHVENQYQIWSLIRYVKSFSSRNNKGGIPCFDVGVAFIGKNPPYSYLKAPQTCYEIREVSGGHELWSICEKSDQSLTEDLRKTSRLSISNDVYVEVFNERGEVIATEETVTENISPRGAALFTTICVEAGTEVRITSVPYSLAVMAMVRACKTGKDGIKRLHLEFIDRQWPLEGIE